MLSNTTHSRNLPQLFGHVEHCIGMDSFYRDNSTVSKEPVLLQDGVCIVMGLFRDVAYLVKNKIRTSHVGSLKDFDKCLGVVLAALDIICFGRGAKFCFVVNDKLSREPALELWDLVLRNICLAKNLFVYRFHHFFIEHIGRINADEQSEIGNPPIVLGPGVKSHSTFDF